MIRLTCANCKTILNIDDGFAGGVCRCQHCGTIQTVPANAPKVTASGAVGGPTPQIMGKGQKALYQGKPRTDVGTGLGDLTSHSVSSGLARAGLRVTATPPAAGVSQPRSPANTKMIMVIGAAVVAVLAVGAVILFSRSSQNSAAPPGQSQKPANPTPNNPRNDTTEDPPAPAVDPAVDAMRQLAGPSFVGVKLQGPTVMYVIDRGPSMTDVFDLLKPAIVKSIGSLKSDMRAQVVFFETGGQLRAEPPAPVAGGDQSAAKLKEALADLNFEFGQSKLAPAFAKAMQEHPLDVVIATAKPVDDDEAKAVLDARKAANSPTRIHIVWLSASAPPGALQSLSQTTGGTLKQVTRSQLEAFVR